MIYTTNRQAIVPAMEYGTMTLEVTVLLAVSTDPEVIFYNSS